MNQGISRLTVFHQNLKYILENATGMMDLYLVSLQLPSLVHQQL